LRVHASTGGNPFFVTELLAAEHEGLPASVSQSVLARVARLPEPTRALLDLLAVVPARADTELLDALCPSWPDAAAPAEERGVVVVHGDAMAFRHELARRAVEEAIPRSRARRLHARVLSVLRAQGAGDHRRARVGHRGAAARPPRRGGRGGETSCNVRTCQGTAARSGCTSPRPVNAFARGPSRRADKWRTSCVGASATRRSTTCERL
jgi:hypothetical protein